MSENDHIAECIREWYASLLRFDFARWKMLRVGMNAMRAIADTIKTVDPEDLKRLMEDEDVEADKGEQE